MLYIHFAILSHLYYVYPLFFGFPSHLCHHQVLRRIVCAISKFSYLFYTQCIYVSLNLPIHLTCVCVCVCVCVRARVRASIQSAPWTSAHKAALSMEFSRQEYRRGLTFASPGDHPTQVSNLSWVSRVGRQILDH